MTLDMFLQAIEVVSEEEMIAILTSRRIIRRGRLLNDKLKKIASLATLKLIEQKETSKPS